VVFHVDADLAAVAKIEVHCKVVMEVAASFICFAEFLSAFLEDELLGKQSAVAANAAVNMEDQLCKDRG